MDEPIALNRTTVTKSDFCELSKALNKGSFNFYFLICGILITALSIYMMVTAIINNTSAVYRGIIFLPVGIFVTIYPFISYIFRANKLYNSQKKLAGEGELISEISFFREYLTVKSAKGQTILNYKDITKHFETKNMFALITKDGVCVFMRKDSFLKGDLSKVYKLFK